MITKKKKKLWVFLLILCIFILSLTPSLHAATLDPESDYGFIQYLYVHAEPEQAITEGLRYLYMFPAHTHADSVRMLIGKSYVKEKLYEKAIGYFQGVAEGENRREIKEEADFWICNTLFRQGNYRAAHDGCNDFLLHYSDSFLKDRLHYLKGWSLLMGWQWNDAQKAFQEIDPNSQFYTFGKDISKEAERLNTIKGKSPVISGILSALLPGAGYVYIGKWQTGIMALLVNGAFIGSSIECFNNDLPILGGIIGVIEMGWYSGTIYGSVNGAQRYNYKIKDKALRSLSQRFSITLLDITF